MEISLRIIPSIAVLATLICFAMLLRQFKVLDEEHGKIFARLVTQITVPAVIFVSLARASMLWSDMLLAFYMFVAELICLSLGWFIGRALKLDAPRMGSVILAAGFGSSALLGYALIGPVFPANAEALTEAAIISELGVGPALFTLGTMIAMYYGSVETAPGMRVKMVLKFFYSPIFFALIGGGLFSALIGPTDNPVVSSVLDGVEVVASANTFIVALTVGLLLKFARFKKIILLAGLVCVVEAAHEKRPI